MINLAFQGHQLPSVLRENQKCEPRHWQYGNRTPPGTDVKQYYITYL